MKPLLAILVYKVSPSLCWMFPLRVTIMTHVITAGGLNDCVCKRQAFQTHVIMLHQYNDMRMGIINRTAYSTQICQNQGNKHIKLCRDVTTTHDATISVQRFGNDAALCAADRRQMQTNDLTEFQLCSPVVIYRMLNACVENIMNYSSLHNIRIV